MTSTIVDQAGVVPAWLGEAYDIAVRWLDERELSTATRVCYAGDLGVPRERWPKRWNAGPSAGAARRREVPPYFAWCVAKGVNPFTVTDHDGRAAWRDALRQAGGGESAVARQLAAVNGWNTAATRSGVAARPAVSLGLSRDEVVDIPLLRCDQVIAMERILHRSPSAVRLRNVLIFRLFVVAGLCRSEIARLRICDIVRDEPTGEHSLQLTYRSVTLPRSLSRLLNRYLKAHRTGAYGVQSLLISKRATPMTREAVAYAMKPTLTVAGLDPEKYERRGTRALARAFRRFAAVTAQERGASRESVRKWLGLSPRSVEALLS